MSLYLFESSEPGINGFFTLRDPSTGERWNANSEAWEASPSDANQKVTATEGSGIHAGGYHATVDGLGTRPSLEVSFHDGDDPNDRVISLQQTRAIVDGSEVAIATEETSLLLPQAIDAALSAEHGEGPWVTGETTFNLTPVTSTVSDGAVSKSSLVAYQYARFSHTFNLTWANGTPINVAGHDLEFVVYKVVGQNLIRLTTGDGITIAGEFNNLVTVVGPKSLTELPGEFRFNLRDLTEESEIRARGSFVIEVENKGVYE
jgi:hypothetical protein